MGVEQEPQTINLIIWHEDGGMIVYSEGINHEIDRKNLLTSTGELLSSMSVNLSLNGNLIHSAISHILGLGENQIKRIQTRGLQTKGRDERVLASIKFLQNSSTLSTDQTLVMKFKTGLKSILLGRKLSDHETIELEKTSISALGEEFYYKLEQLEKSETPA